MMLGLVSVIWDSKVNLKARVVEKEPVSPMSGVVAWNSLFLDFLYLER